MKLILPGGGPVYYVLDDGTAVELAVYPAPPPAPEGWVQLGLKGRKEEQARVLGASTGRPAKQKNKGAQPAP